MSGSRQRHKKRKQQVAFVPASHEQLERIKALQITQQRLAVSKLDPLYAISYFIRLWLFFAILPLINTPYVVYFLTRSFTPEDKNPRTQEFIQLFSELRHQAQEAIKNSTLLTKYLNTMPGLQSGSGHYAELLVLSSFPRHLSIKFKDLINRISSAIASTLPNIDMDCLDDTFVENLRSSLNFSKEGTSDEQIGEMIRGFIEVDRAGEFLTQYTRILYTQMTLYVIHHGLGVLFCRLTSNLNNYIIKNPQEIIDAIDYSRRGLSAEDAGAVIEGLEKTNKKWRYTAHRNRIAACLIFCIVYAYYCSVEGIAKAMLAAAVFLLAVLVKGRAEIKTMFHYCRYPLSYKEKQLNAALKTYLHSPVKLHVEESPDTSYFLIQAQAYELMNATNVCQTIKEVLLQHNLPIDFEGKITLTLPGYLYIDTYLAATINRQLEQALARLLSGKKLKHQMDEIAKLLRIQCTCIAMREETGLTASKFILFDFPRIGRTLLNNQTFARLFVTAQFVQEKDLVVERGNAIDDAVFAEFINRLKELQKQESTRLRGEREQQLRYSTAAISHQLAKIPRGMAAATDVVETKVAEVADGEDPLPIHWSTGSYDPAHPPVVSDNIDEPLPPLPLQSDHIPARKCMLFTQLLIEKRHLPTDRQYRAFRELAIRSQVAAAREEQGFRFLRQPTSQYDTEGRLFTAVIDLKGLGENNNIRIYGEEERAPTGELLYKMKGVNLHRH